MAGVVLVFVVVVLLVADLKADFVVVAAVDAAGCWEVPMYQEVCRQQPNMRGKKAFAIRCQVT